MEQAGTRPIRTVVASASQSSYPQKINERAEQETRAYLERLSVLPRVTLTETGKEPQSKKVYKVGLYHERVMI